MTAQVQHTPKAGARLTGAEYEAADHHTISGVALDDHNHDATYSATTHDHDASYAAASHTHGYVTAAEATALAYFMG